METVIKITKILFLVMVFLIVNATKCYKNREDCHQIIYVNNTSNKLICTDAPYHSSVEDTTWIDITPVGLAAIEKHYTGGITRDKCCEKETLIRCFIFDDDVVNRIESNGRRVTFFDYDSVVLIRYDLSPDDLQRLNWHLTYPPNEAMRNIQMYPPYEEVIANAQ